MTALTRRQSEALDFIQSYVAANGIAPAYTEIASALDLNSKSGVHRLVKELEDRGAIRVLANRARGIEIVRPQPAAIIHLRAVLASFSENGILFAEAPAVVAAMQFLGRRPAQ